MDQKVVFLFDDYALVREFEAEGVPVVGLGGTPGLLRLPRLLRPVTEAIQSWGRSVVSTQLPAADILGRFAARRTRSPVVSTWQSTTYHGSRLDSGLRVRTAVRILQVLERISARWAARFIAVSEPVLESYTVSLGIDRSRCCVVPNSLDLSRFSAVRPRVCSRAGGPIRLVHAGRHVRQKGLDVLLRAVAMIPPEHSISVHLFGAGPHTERLQRLAVELGVSSRVKFRGVVEDSVPHLSSADGFVFPSRYEGLALAYLEALAAGLPVIASGIAENRAIDPGARATRFFEPGNADDLCQALIDFSARPELRAAYAANARALVAPFAIESVGPQLLSIYESVCGER